LWSRPDPPDARETRERSSLASLRPNVLSVRCLPTAGGALDRAVLLAVVAAVLGRLSLTVLRRVAAAVLLRRFGGT
jgi:hypothetical protein